MHNQIRGLRSSTEAILIAKGVKYSELRGALTPDPRKKEIALVFDTYELQEHVWYGLPVFERVFDLIDRRSSHSFLMGDLIGENHQQDALFEQFCEVFIPARDFTWRHSGMLYLVYINNLTDGMIVNIHNNLLDFPAYSGFADCTYYSRFKRHISFNLVNLFVKHKEVVIQSHEGGVPNTENHNASGYPFEKYGYKNRSVDDITFGVMLSYKIERPVYPGSEADEEFSLNYLTLTPSLLKNFTVSVDDAKADYLRRNKGDSLERANLQGASAAELAALIATKISGSYIYSMQVNEFGDRLFNVIIEVAAPDGTRTRLLCGLKYRESEKNLALVTMF